MRSGLRLLMIVSFFPPPIWPIVITEYSSRDRELQSNNYGKQVLVISSVLGNHDDPGNHFVAKGRNHVLGTTIAVPSVTSEEFY